MATIVGADDTYIYIDDNTGAVRKILIDAATGVSNFSQLSGQATQAQLATPTPNWFNVKAYGAKGDTQAVDDAVSSGTDTITSVTANFSAADVGKVCFGVYHATGLAFVARGTIASVSSATVCHVTTTSFIAGYPSLRFCWGTDDTVALQAAFTAAKASGIQGSLVYAPAGGYMFSAQPFNNSAAPGIGLVGDGQNKTVFYPTPDFDFSTTTANSGMLTSNSITNNLADEFRDFGYDGNYLNFGSGSIDRYAMEVSFVPSVRNIHLQNIGGTEGAGYAGGIRGNQRGVWQNIFAVQIAGALPAIIVIAGQGTIINCTGSNSSENFWIEGAGETEPVFGDLVIIGGYNDEGGTPTSLHINGATGVHIFGYSMFGGLGVPAVIITGNSDVTMHGCKCRPWSSEANAGGVQIDSGSILRASGTKFEKNGSGVGITNNGTFYDLGGNTIDSLSGSGSYITSMASAALVVGTGSAGTAVTTTAVGSGPGPAAPQTIVKYAPISLPEGSFWVPLVQ